jgi:hypothetical protein
MSRPTCPRLRVHCSVGAIALVLATAAPIEAQDSSAVPPKGSWGGEISSGYLVSLLRTTSATAAWVLSAGLGRRHSEYTFSAGATRDARYDNFYGVDLRAGRRWSRTPSQRSRHYVGLGVGYAYQGAASPEFWSHSGLGYAELGMSHFFSPHLAVSVASVNRLTINHTHQQSEDGQQRYDAHATVLNSEILLRMAVFF